MGVKDLWPTIEGVKETVLFSDIQGQKVAVDLSMWIVDSQHVKSMKGAISKPYLRNLFFRTTALLNCNVTPIFVIEGEAPELKWNTMAARQLSQGKVTKSSLRSKPNYGGRRCFNGVVKECCEMLDWLGLPYVQSDGEAEALCAQLNSRENSLVDAVITGDGDALLYGASIIYRNFNSTKGTIDRYDMRDIEEKLGLFREHLVSIALLNGCDYSPKGVSGVGKSLTLKFCADYASSEILDCLKCWNRESPHTNLKLTNTGRNVSQKIQKASDLHFSPVIEEFYKLRRIDYVPDISWRKPLISKAQDFNSVKLEWPIKYSFDKVFPLVVLWNLQQIARGSLTKSSASISPETIVKKRVRVGIDSLEVLWELSDPFINDEENEINAQSLSTIEPTSLLSLCYSDMVEEFTNSKTKQTRQEKAKEPKRKPQVSNHLTSESDQKDHCFEKPLLHTQFGESEVQINFARTRLEPTNECTGEQFNTLSGQSQSDTDNVKTCTIHTATRNVCPRVKHSTDDSLPSLDFSISTPTSKLKSSLNVNERPSYTPDSHILVDLCTPEVDEISLLMRSHRITECVGMDSDITDHSISSMNRFPSNQQQTNTPRDIATSVVTPSITEPKRSDYKSSNPRDSLEVLLAGISEHVNHSTPGALLPNYKHESHLQNGTPQNSYLHSASPSQKSESSIIHSTKDTNPNYSQQLAKPNRLHLSDFQSDISLLSPNNSSSSSINPSAPSMSYGNINIAPSASFFDDSSNFHLSKLSDL